MAGSMVWQCVDSAPQWARGQTLALVNVGCGDMLAFASGVGFDGTGGIGGVQPYATRVYRSRDHGNSWDVRATWRPMEWFMEFSYAWSTGRLGEAAIGTYGPDRGGPIEPGLGIALTRDIGNSYMPVVARSLFVGGLPTYSGSSDQLLDLISIMHGARMAGSDTQIACGYAFDNSMSEIILLRSVDGGLSYREAIPYGAALAGPSGTQVVGIPPNIWVAGIDAPLTDLDTPGVLRSTDDGKTWTRVAIDPPPGKVWNVGGVRVLVYVGSDVVLASGYGSTTPVTPNGYPFFRSTDAGVTWTPQRLDDLPGDLTAVGNIKGLVSLGNNVIVMGAQHSGIVAAHRPFWFSEDGGLAWSNANTYLPSCLTPNEYDPHQMAVSDDGAVVVVGFNQGQSTIEWWRGTYSPAPASGLAGALGLCSYAFFPTPPAQESCA